MTIAAKLHLLHKKLWPHSLIWAALLCIIVWLGREDSILPWVSHYPKPLILPLAAEISAIAKIIVQYASGFTRALSALIEIPLRFSTHLFADGFTIGGNDNPIHIPRLSWIGIIGAMTWIGYGLGGARLATLCTCCFGYLAFFGQWDSAMLTFSFVAFAVPIGVLAGLPIGIAAYFWPSFDRFCVRPALDLMQTIPAFAYIIPTLLLFGFTPVTPMIATILFAMPPMVRMVTLALSRVAPDIQEFADMAGCTKIQKLFYVLIPSAASGIMVGINQVIMMSLNMVIIASMIGAGGLGFDVLFALRNQKIGQGLEAGLAITALAIVLDRMSQQAAHASSLRLKQKGLVSSLHFTLLLGLAWLFITTALSTKFAFFERIPTEATVTTAPIWGELVRWINVNFFDTLDAFRTTLLLYLLNPVKQALLAAPWAGVTALVFYGGVRLGGWRLGILVASLVAFSALTGLWDKAMVTIYLCAISAIIASMIGIMLGIWASRSILVRKILTILIDTLQTLPSFVYLIPVVMLFRVGDVTAMIAVIAFALTPAFRYTLHGILETNPSLIEAARAIGCTRRQILLKIQLPLALPEILLGMSQTILLALSMLVITALVGTRDLGQEVYIALTKVDTGRGIVAGLAIAFLGIASDRLIFAAAEKFRLRLGLNLAGKGRRSE